jgi:hypothetical protein
MFGGRYSLGDVKTWGIVSIEDLDEKRPGIRRLDEWAQEAYRTDLYDPIPVQMEDTYSAMFRKVRHDLMSQGVILMRTSPTYRVVLMENETPKMRGYFVLFSHKREEQVGLLYEAFGFVSGPEYPVLPQVVLS